ncbi:MAG: hypothetical protein KDF24_06450 [Rhodocyclaceae bacterium]|nr:hypothetical protein [Rhodocyclaceae bacterium]MCB1962792.1 hypothetical protein [Rhodocyclaceae bacterium]
MSAQPGYPTQPELALVAALDLATRYASTGNPRLAAALVTQLRCIAAEAQHPLAVRRCAAHIVGDWAHLATPLPVPGNHSNAT